MTSFAASRQARLTSLALAGHDSTRSDCRVAVTRLGEASQALVLEPSCFECNQGTKLGARAQSPLQPLVKRATQVLGWRATTQLALSAASLSTGGEASQALVLEPSCFGRSQGVELGARA